MGYHGIGYSDHDQVSGIDDIGIKRLASECKASLIANRRRNAEIEARNDEIDLSMPHMELLKKKIAELIKKRADESETDLPVISVYDALQTAKRSKAKDHGVRALTGQLEALWKKDRGASLSSKSFTTLRDHYQRNFPKSAVNGVFEGMVREGYLSLPMSDLMSLAAQIHSQEDFDRVINENGLVGMQPNRVKARNFILSLVNKESECPFEGGGKKAYFEDDESIATELHDYAMNDGDLYRRRFQPISKNLQRKWEKGEYDHDLAIKGWMYLVDDAAKGYAKEFGGEGGRDWNEMFPKNIRLMAAESIAQYWEREQELGNWK